MLDHLHELNYSRLYPMTYKLPIHETLPSISVHNMEIPHGNQASNPLREWRFTS